MLTYDAPFYAANNAYRGGGIYDVSSNLPLCLQTGIGRNERERPVYHDHQVRGKGNNEDHDDI